LVQTASGTNRDKQGKSFVDSPQRGENYTAQEVFVGNTQNDPIPVDPTTRGTPKTLYNEVVCLPGATATIINFTVGIGVGVDSIGAYCSGDNIAYFIIEINSQVKFKGRTHWNDFNLPINLISENLQAGDNIKIIVQNNGIKTADFNATLKYGEFSV
jgi:hypothetical protein